MGKLTLISPELKTQGFYASSHKVKKFAMRGKIVSKTILITGAGHGFGKGAAFGLARAGHKVIAAVQICPRPGIYELKQKNKSSSLK